MSHSFGYGYNFNPAAALLMVLSVFEKQVWNLNHLCLDGGLHELFVYREKW
jgi:hypothetical protein